MDSHYTGAPPPEVRPRTEIVRVTTSTAQQFTIFSKSIYGQNIHWYARRSHECTKDFKRCNGCDRNWPAKWLGYLHAWHLGEDKPCFIELTRTACDLLVRQAPEKEPLRGLQVRISKSRGGPKGRYHVEVLERRVADAQLPQERDPLTVLRFLWTCKNQHVQDGPASV